MHTSLMNAAHELFHQMVGGGEEDVYGSMSHSSSQSLMAGTVFDGSTQTTDQLRDAFHLDPWHKMIVGWIQPRIVDAGFGGGCVNLHAPDQLRWRPGEGPLLITNPVVPDRYFLAEWRNSNVDVHDRNHPGRGVALWYVELDAALRPKFVPGGFISLGPNRVLDSVVAPGSDDLGGSRRILPGSNRALESLVIGDDTSGQDATVWTVGSPSAGVPGARGATSTWTANDGEVELTFSRNRPVHIAGHFRLRVGPFNDRAPVRLEWRNEQSGNLRPRLDGVTPSSFRTGQRITVDGMFRVDRAHVRAELTGTGRTFPLTVENVSCERATVVVPPTVPPGRYHLAFFGDSGTSGRSNRMVVTITP
jgi:hypothetical protein